MEVEAGKIVTDVVFSHVQLSQNKWAINCDVNLGHETIRIVKTTEDRELIESFCDPYEHANPDFDVQRDAYYVGCFDMFEDAIESVYINNPDPDPYKGLTAEEFERRPWFINKWGVLFGD